MVVDQGRLRTTIWRPEDASGRPALGPPDLFAPPARSRRTMMERPWRSELWSVVDGAVGRVGGLVVDETPALGAAAGLLGQPRPGPRCRPGSSGLLGERNEKTADRGRATKTWWRVSPGKKATARSLSTKKAEERRRTRTSGRSRARRGSSRARWGARERPAARLGYRVETHR